MVKKEESRESPGNPIFNVIKTEWKYLGSRRRIFLAFIFLFTIAGTIALMTPLVIGLIFNSIQNSITSEVELRKLVMLISLLFFIKVGFWAFHGTARVLEERTGFFVRRNYINRKINQVLELPIKWHKDHHSGETIDKINRASGAIESFSNSFTFQIVYAIINIFGSLIILFFVDFKIALFAFIFSSVVLYVIMKFDKKLRVYYKELNVYSNKVSSALFDYISNIFTVITLRLKRTVAREIDDRVMASQETNKKAVVLNEIKWGFGDLAISLMTVAVLIFKAHTEYTTNGLIMIGTLYILYGYLERAGGTFQRFAQIYGDIVRYDSRLVGVRPIEEEFEKVRKEIGEKLPDNWAKVELRNFDFKYDQEGEKKHLNKVNIAFNRGQRVALIGESGSGKSTILSLMRGLYPPDKGDVYCDGEKLPHGTTRLKHHITLIPQDPEIFNNTIKYNVTMDLNVKKEHMEKAIKMAQFEKVVDRLEKGLNTNVLEKGVSLSGGEKQRLALARGILAARKSEILLLDEPTSSVDNLNEMKIYDNLFRVFAKKTIISSIHRLHLLKRFDYVYMFDKGKIVAEGSLDKIKKNPRFTKVWEKYGMTGEIK